MIKSSSQFIFAISCIIVSGCATNNSSSGQKKSFGNPIVPSVQKFTLPGGNTSNWRYLGTTNDNKIADEINDASVESSNNSQTFKFQDRKTIINMETFQYSTNQPKYKFAISNWLIDCNNKQYILTDTTIYDLYGNQLKNYNYHNNDNLKWLHIGNGSLANMQYNYVCLNINRNLGY